MVDKGVIFNKFQIMDLGHMEYILAAKVQCRKLYIGICEPEKTLPYTYIERFEKLCEQMTEFGVKREAFEIIPFPIERPETVMNYAPKDAVYYMRAKDPDEQGAGIKRMLESMGVEVQTF